MLIKYDCYQRKTSGNIHFQPAVIMIYFDSHTKKDLTKLERNLIPSQVPSRGKPEKNYKVFSDYKTTYLILCLRWLLIVTKNFSAFFTNFPFFYFRFHSLQLRQNSLSVLFRFRQSFKLPPITK